MWDTILNVIDHKITPQKAVALWDGDPHSVELVSTGINLVYRFKRHDEICYLRLTHGELKKISELESALSFQDYLHQTGVPVCPLIFSDRGNWIEPIAQEQHQFLAHVCAGVPGEPIHFNVDNHLLYENWGKALGQFHAASSRYPKDDLKYNRWENDIAEFSDYAKNEDQIIQAELNEAFDFFKHHPQLPENYGLIHGDHRKANVLTDGKQIHFIDFDLPRYCWFMDDITRPFFNNILKQDNHWQNKLPHYIRGYRSVFPLSDAELKTFSWFMRYKALNIYLWTKSNWQGDVAPGGENIKNWLELMRKMILDRSWVDDVNQVIQTL